MKGATNGAQKKRQKTDRMKFSVLARRLRKHGLYEMSPASALKYMIEAGAVPPDTKRIPETFDQVTFKRKIKGLTLIVHTSFNPTLSGNDPQKKKNGLFSTAGGAIWVLILDEQGKRIFTRKRYRTATSIERIPTEIEFLVDRLMKRPMFKGKGRLVHKATIKVFNQKTYWVSPVSDSVRQAFFMFGIPVHLRAHAKSLEYSRQYYRKYVRKKNGALRTENQIRKKWHTPS